MEPDRTIKVTKEVGTMRQFIRTNNGPPLGDEWRANLETFQTQIMDQMERLPELYVKFEDNEVTQNGLPFAYQINPDLNEQDGIHLLSAISKNLLDKSHREKLLFLKLLEDNNVDLDFDNLDMGFRHSNGDQSAFLDLMNEKVRAMYRGPYICLPCATSFAQTCDLKVHIKAKHANHINMEALINRPGSRLEQRVREMEQELENLRSQHATEMLNLQRANAELTDQLGLVQQNLIHDREDRGFQPNARFFHPVP